MSATQPHGVTLGERDRITTDARIRALQEENAQLRTALANRIVIEQAKGAVSARFRLSPEESFELIRGLARSQRRRIHDFAAEVVQNFGGLQGVEGDGGAPLAARTARPRPSQHGSGPRLQRTSRPPAWD